MPLDFQDEHLLINSAARCCEESRKLIAECREHKGVLSEAITTSIELLSHTLNHRAEPELFRKASWASRNGDRYRDLFD
jgi:hypothetical protein